MRFAAWFYSPRAREPCYYGLRVLKDPEFFWPSPSKIILFITILAMKTTINQNCHFFFLHQEKLSGLEDIILFLGLLNETWLKRPLRNQLRRTRAGAVNLVFAWLLSYPQLLCFSSLGSQAETRPRVRTKLWDQVSPCARNFFTRLYVWEDPWGSGDPRLPFTWKKVLEVKAERFKIPCNEPGRDAALWSLL